MPSIIIVCVIGSVICVVYAVVKLVKYCKYKKGGWKLSV